MAIRVVILAAGRGKRMHSTLPKPLHILAGKTLLEHVLLKTAQLPCASPPIVVINQKKNSFAAALTNHNVVFVEQKEPLGTADAVKQTLSMINADEQILILSADVPLVSIETLRKLIEITPPNQIGMITAFLSNPHGYGRIIRNENGRIIKIVEEKDLTADERKIKEINAGIYLIPGKFLLHGIPLLQKQNNQGEYYLTDIIGLAIKENIPVHSLQPAENDEILGINNRIQLASLERFYQRRYAEKLMEAGVTLLDPNRFDVRGDANIGSDVIIDVNVILEGQVIIGSGCSIGPNTILRNVTLGENVEIRANTIIEDAVIDSDCIIGPFARIRPSTRIDSHVHIGNFVEIKNSRIGKESKINHLSYIGDAEIGKRVNIGAGTITCNYDGAYKHKTWIGDDVQIGSDTQLIAPIKVGDGATIGAGSTIIKDVPPGELTLTHRLSQRIVQNWSRPEKTTVKK